MCLIFIILFLGTGKYNILFASLIFITWIFPAIIPVLSFGIKFSTESDPAQHCFPAVKDYVFLGFMIPLVLLGVTNLILTIATLFYIHFGRRQEEHRPVLKKILGLVLVFTICLLVPWLVLAISSLTEYYLIKWISMFISSTVGVFFLIFMLVGMGMKDVKLFLFGEKEKEEQDIYYDIVEITQRQTGAQEYSKSNSVTDNVHYNPFFEFIS